MYAYQLIKCSHRGFQSHLNFTKTSLGVAPLSIGTLALFYDFPTIHGLGEAHLTRLAPRATTDNYVAVTPQIARYDLAPKDALFRERSHIREGPLAFSRARY